MIKLEDENESPVSNNSHDGDDELLVVVRPEGEMELIISFRVICILLWFVSL